MNLEEVKNFLNKTKNEQSNLSQDLKQKENYTEEEYMKKLRNLQKITGITKGLVNYINFLEKPTKEKIPKNKLLNIKPKKNFL